MSIETILERIADALEVIAASKSAGSDAPRTASTTKPEAPASDDAKKAEAKAKRDAKAAADKKSKDEAAAAASLDPLGGSPDPLAGGDVKKEYGEKDVREILAKLIDKEGRAAAFEVLAAKGKGAKAFTDLKKENYEDVYVECEERLA